MTTISLRPAQRADLPFIGKLCARSTSIHHEGIGYPRCEDEKELLAELALYENSLEEHVFVVCDQAGDPVGVTGFLVDDDDEPTYTIGPLLDGPWRTAAVAAEVLRWLVESPLGGRRLLNYVEEDNVVLVEALRDNGWQPGEVHLEMRYEVAATNTPPAVVADTPPIRRLTGRDDPAFGAVADLVGRQHGWTSNAATRLADLLDDGYHVALSEQDGRLAGCALWIYLDNTDFGRLDYLSVDEAFRRRSYGSALATHALEDAHRTDGVEDMFLSLDPTNDVAHRLYLRCGFADSIRSRRFSYERG